jgi:hypothetical protein
MTGRRWRLLVVAGERGREAGRVVTTTANGSG